MVESAPEVPLQPLGSGWTLDGVIGAGGMGTVYRAKNAKGERAAVKLLHPNLVGHSGTLKRVLREAELLGKLKHPGICQLKEAGLYGDDRPFVVMELLAGHSLKERHQTAPFSPAELLDFAIQVLEALAYAHGKGVVHRDLKPSNLFLTSQGRVKILDFGVARSLLEDNASQSSVGELIGTPAFMAPEQAAGRHDAVCPQTDIWSLGATLFTLLIGEYVHSGRTEAERLGRAMTVAPRAVRSVLPECPEALAEVIDKALAFEVQDRFRSAVSMRCALKNVSVGERALFALNRRSGDESGETLVVGRGEKAPSDMVSVASEASASGSRAAGTEASGEFEIPAGPSVQSSAIRSASPAPLSRGDIRTALLAPNVIRTLFIGFITHKLAQDRLEEFRSALARTIEPKWIMDLNLMEGFEPLAIKAGSEWWKQYKGFKGNSVFFVSDQSVTRMAGASLSFSVGLRVLTFDTLGQCLEYLAVPEVKQAGYW